MTDEPAQRSEAAALAAVFDHTALRPDATPGAIEVLCGEAREHGFAAVCVAPCWVSLAAGLVASSAVRVASVVGFPHGNTLASVKAFEAARCRDAGADELDAVLNVGALRAADHELVRRDLAAVVGAASGAPVKVILEAGWLTDAEKRTACRLAEECGAAWVKTSTGFGGSRATADDVRLLAACVGGRLGVKAAGGIRTLADARAMLAAGATRLGCSASVAILEELAAEGAGGR